MVTTTKYVWDPVFDCVTHELDENNAVNGNSTFDAARISRFEVTRVAVPRR